MKIFTYLSLSICFLLVFLTPAHAQDTVRIVPQSMPQVQLTFAPLVKKVSPAVVNIYTKRVVANRARHPFFDDPFFGNLFDERMFGGRMREQVQNSLGSGVIVAADGLVVTNSHVIDGADEITVVLSDGRSYDADLALLDPPSDLALLRIETDGEKLPFVTLAPSESLEVGDLVLAIGNPFGVGQTVTSGIVSAVARSSLSINDFNFFIQTDAAINPGNSGGPLVAMDGTVVGINTAIFSRDGGSLGIGFAVPSEMVASVIAAEGSDSVSERGIARPWLGVEAQRVTSDLTESLQLDTPRGALVVSLHPASPARDAGIEVGDVILSVNGKDIRDASEVKFRMATVPLGQKADFEVWRKGKTRRFQVLATLPPDTPARKTTRLEGAHPFNGVTVSNINPAVLYELGSNADVEEGVIVSDIAPRARANRLVRPGDLILQVNNDEIEDVSDLERALRRADGRGWQIVTSRDGQVRQVVIR